MSIEQVVNAVDIAINKLPHMESLYRQIKDEVDKLQYTRQVLVNDIAALKHKISILDKTAFSLEQDCRRKHQEIQELIAQKDRIEKLIANILNGEGHSMIKQIVKEYVKAMLSENKKLISICFAALILTLKADPQMTKLIQNIPGVIDGKQQKDNHINITQYFESNKDSLVDLAEKHYESLVEALTNNAVDNTSPNPTLSSSSSTSPSSFDQIDTYRREEPETYHNDNDDNKLDIAD